MSTIREVILLKDVKNLGVRGFITKVKGGYARNFLIPKEYAVFASPANLAKLEKNKQKIEKENAEALAKAQATADSMQGISLSISCKANAKDGKLFGSITTRDIIVEIKKNKDIDIKSQDISVGSIKYLGEYTVEIALHPTITVRLPLSVKSPQDDSSL